MSTVPTSAISFAIPAGASRHERMKSVVDVIWERFGSPRGKISWIGFYLDQPGQLDDRRLVLGPCRDKPACSPIGLHGVCGSALLDRATQIVRDVRKLGPNYIACDPRDRSEIVIPLLDKSETCWGILDVDSWDVGAFDPRDEANLREVLVNAGLMDERKQVQ